MRNFTIGSGEGRFCIPLDLDNIDISGIQDGANVTSSIFTTEVMVAQSF